MKKSKKVEVVRWFIIRSSSGLGIMKVDTMLVSEFKKVYRPYIMAEGMSLWDVLSKSDWAEQAKGVQEDSISN